jgi:NAD+ synthase (glutamine-hydrolysing)
VGVGQVAKPGGRKRGDTPPIPPNSIEKPPSAELRPGQLDQDSLPDYAVLDAILDLFIIRGLDIPDIVAEGFDETQSPLW